MRAKIYKLSKSAMQSGRGKDASWILECDESVERRPEPLMGWTSSNDTKTQIKLKFSSLDDAKAYATKNGLNITVLPPRERKIKPRNYADNFRYKPEETQQ